MRWLWKNKVHVLIWGIFVIYTLVSSDLYTAIFLKHGKPLTGSANLPAEMGEIHLMVDELRVSVYEGEEVYLLSGWVFAPGIPESGSFKKKLVLHSTHEDLVFPAETVVRKDLTNVFSQYEMNLDEAGFRVMITKHALEIDNYRIGILLEDSDGTPRAYRLLDRYIQREPNRVRYVGH